MFKKLLLLLVALFLAWNFGPALSGPILALVAAVVGAGAELSFEAAQSKGVSFWFQLVVWLVVFWAVIPYLWQFLFGYAVPSGQRHAGSKLVRRVQGVTARLLPMLLFLAVATFGYMWTSHNKRHLIRPVWKIAYKARSSELIGEIDAKREDIQSLIDDATRFIDREQEWFEQTASAEQEYLEAWERLENLNEAMELDRILRDPDAQEVLVDESIDDAIKIRMFLCGEIGNEYVRWYEISLENGFLKPDHDKYTENIVRELEDASNLIVDDQSIFIAKSFAAHFDAHFLKDWANDDPWPYDEVIFSVYNELDTATEVVVRRRRHDEILAEPKQYRREWYAMLAELDDEAAAAAPGGPLDHEIRDEHIARLDEALSWRGLFLETLRRHPLPPLSLAALGYFFLYLPQKPKIAGVYIKTIRFLEQGRFGLGGSGRFAGMFEEWELPYRQNSYSLYLGRSLYNSLCEVGIEDDRHMLTIAGSRAGKGTTTIIPNLLLWKGSALVIDPKGTNAAVTARAREEMGHAVHVVDPFDVLGNGKTASFNPLDEIDPESKRAREQVLVLADALVVPDPHTKDRHWDDGARTVIAGMLAHLITNPPHGGSPWIGDIREWLTLPMEDTAALWVDMKANTSMGGLARDAAARVIRGIKTNEILGILSNADKHTDWLGSEAIGEALRRSAFTFGDLKRQPTTVYLVLPPEFLATHNRFLRLFVNMAINRMSVGGRSKIPVLLMLDEFLALGRMEEVEKAFSLMAGYNLTIWPFVQDFARLKDLYETSANTFITNSRAIQAYGVFDETTCEFISKQLGNRVPASVIGSGANRLGVPLRDPSEVARDIEAGSGRQYILRAGKSPLLLEKVPYYQEGALEALGDQIGKAVPLLRGRMPSARFVGRYDKDPDY